MQTQTPTQHHCHTHTTMAPPATFLVVFSLLALSPLYSSEDDGSLYPQFYDHSCPKAQEIVTSVVAKAVAKDTRMAASLIRLHFHDCFVQGCDASVLLDSSGTLTSEKRSNPNRNSARGFEVIEEIKSALEKECPRTVSCADILALAARDSTVMTGGPSWEVPLGRRDSLGTSVQGSNNNIPAPNNTLQTIITKFKNRGLGIVDLVALSGCHTIGNSRCTSFRQRLYNQTGNGQPDATLDPAYAAQLRARCPQSGGDQNLFPLDPVTQFKFDNQYFKNLLANKGLLNSDEVLVSGGGATAELVEKYAASMEAFFEQFAESMVKMGNITPLTGSEGEIRSRCRQINH
ncbi:peroxidase 72 [Canna indica]|uniref:Peroxidase n=1 Tax=Canna indica TaxID=4628 RepID=A0AAQ3L110_9LILI|nr:peroxidase 72 [Canna indica]